MRRWSILIGVVIAGCAGARDAAVDVGPGEPGTADEAADPEVARIQRHLAGAEAALRAADVSHLTLAQRAARAVHVERLRRYRAAGVFPHNHDLPGARTPVFVDRHGTRCAMAHLIEHAGGAELVASVTRTRNLATVPELADEPGLADWLDRNGLTLAEATRIQPAYTGCDWQPCDDDEVEPQFLYTSLGLAVVGGISVGYNLTDDARPVTGALGIVLGGASLALGVRHRDDPRELQRGLATGDIVIGAITIAAGLRALLRTPPAAAAAAPPAGPPGGWTVAPALGEARGVVVSTRF